MCRFASGYTLDGPLDTFHTHRNFAAQLSNSAISQTFPSLRCWPPQLRGERGASELLVVCSPPTHPPLPPSPPSPSIKYQLPTGLWRPPFDWYTPAETSCANPSPTANTTQTHRSKPGPSPIAPFLILPSSCGLFLAVGAA